MVEVPEEQVADVRRVETSRRGLISIAPGVGSLRHLPLEMLRDRLRPCHVAI
jgi:hypothetical protein